ncbi:chemotaxis protein CheW [Peribacillus huizhouensis]|uniref:Purine-binding chemotaxis protein CheW n=1 Tax=Peribacillus huizhouensis TaxID=1501239 RepID=A0ABR6CIH5_9BACI|nr:chemotaxis protein CheW [Peribacillus huizhouensis]MBA9024847.1 purine-binding chemotaxis protein CheW [Peribacillus huizhouensis]
MEAIVTSETVKVIVFQIKDKEYVIPVAKVRGIEKMMHITRVPRSLPFVKGVINLRGGITPIIDLRARFEIEKAAYDDRTRIIIVSLDNMEAGLIVDSANDVLDIPEASIEPQPEVIGNVAMEYISGVAKVEKRLLTLLNLDQILNQDEINDTVVKEA